MTTILILGAGRSSSNLIKYLLEAAPNEGWHVRVGDMDEVVAASKVKSDYGSSFKIVPGNNDQIISEIGKSDVVVSMLPAGMHPQIARWCIAAKKNLVTPSYISDEMAALDSDAKAAGVLILNEMGVDPGIDHMSAMEIIHHLQESGAELQSFESFTGGLIAPESDNNPWNYKITWNPRNVVLAGYGGTARYLEGNKLKLIPYHRLFSELTPVFVEGYGDFEGYANRDSVKYRKIYGLDGLPTLYRGTLRRKGYSEAWNALIQIGLTDDSFEIDGLADRTWRELTSSFLSEKDNEDIEMAVRAKFCSSEAVLDKLKWLGIFSSEPIGIEKGSPAVALQTLIERKWKLAPDDKDMIVMWHRFIYTLEGKRFEKESSMVCLGDDPTYTAMSKTVGLPIGIAIKLILHGKWEKKGVHLPITSDFYVPVMRELETLGIQFNETEKEIHV
ncbi:MAG: saccharopine dehydrogenase C-terminal domain-containing protein [Flavobacteriales bacterium]|jgi:saccharopine dehydrogenase-like NADP-dependent oxidoreductase